MSYDDLGHDYEREVAEEVAIAQHDSEHQDPLEFWGECDCCDSRIEGDLENGIRCQHGNLIPWTRDEKGYLNTDMECPDCWIDYGPSIYAIDGTWVRIQERIVESHAA